MVGTCDFHPDSLVRWTRLRGIQTGVKYMNKYQSKNVELRPKTETLKHCETCGSILTDENLRGYGRAFFYTDDKWKDHFFCDIHCFSRWYVTFPSFSRPIYAHLQKKETCIVCGKACPQFSKFGVKFCSQECQDIFIVSHPLETRSPALVVYEQIRQQVGH